MRLPLVDCKLLQFHTEAVHCVTKTLGLGEMTLWERARAGTSWIQGNLASFEGIARRLSAWTGALGQGT